MKKITFFLFAVALLFICPALAKMPFAPDEVIGLHIGPKNPMFDESKYPDIKFFYTPNIKWSTDKVTGSPEALAKWLSQKGLRPDEAIVIDKDGIGAFIGFVTREKDILDAMGMGDLDTLGNVLKNVVEENNAAPFVTDKPLKWDDLSGMLGRKFPKFEIVNAAGEVTTTAAVIYDNKLPKMIFVFRIPPDHKFKTAEDEMKDVETPLQALSGMANIFTGDEYVLLLDRIERDLYGR